MEKKDCKTVIIRLSYSDTSKNFFVDFWTSNDSTFQMALKITEQQANAMSKELGIKILIQ